MAEQISIGEFTVTTLRDGVSHLPPSAYPGANFDDYPDLLDDSGTYAIRLGAHLVQGPSGTFLIDAGAGDFALPFPADLAAANGLTSPPRDMARAGALPDALAGAGVDPADITMIFVTHLHLDHIGWLMKDGRPFFPNATVIYGAEDWAELVDGVNVDDPARAIMLAADEAGILRTYGGLATGELPMGLDVVPVPGHTPGHVMITLQSGEDEIWFVGDLIEHPGQLTDRNIHFMTDVDRAAATRARADLFAHAQRDSIVIAAAHLEDPTFRLITADFRWADATN
jgi:glyoxylase-like metal-dependent hydrolase (beta-lactamase superfamily II)